MLYKIQLFLSVMKACKFNDFRGTEDFCESNNSNGRAQSCAPTVGIIGSLCLHWGSLPAIDLPGNLD
jgi:hypothetical protein